MSVPSIGYELFPPRSELTPKWEETANDIVLGAEPWLVSVTSKPESDAQTDDAVDWLRQNQPAPAMPHVVCSGATRTGLQDKLGVYHDRGINHVLLLAGDPPANPRKSSGELRYASELIDVAQSVGKFTIAVAVSPEPHPLSVDAATDLRFQAAKLKRADLGISQFFFRAASFDRLQQNLAALGNETPLVPGLLLSTSLPAIQRMADGAGITIPDSYHAALQRASHADAATGNRDEMTKVVSEHVSALADELVDGGAQRLHLFTLNQPALTGAVVQNLGLANAA